MIRTALLATASALALGGTAAAQDHAHDAHAGHAGHIAAPEATVTVTDLHAGHDGHGASTGVLGPYPMSREISGTSWQPDAERHEGVHARRGDWDLMGHVLLNGVYTDQSGPRGDQKAFVAGMVMGAARRTFADGDVLNLRAMVSPDPWMGKRGYPLLLAAGESADGREPLVDRQHPHELVMELSGSYAWRLSDTDSVFLYAGWPGEPAFGPTAFMHRGAAMDNPEAPISHHWLDSTHIVFGVVTAGWVRGPLKLEASAFKGREPDEDRFDLEHPRLDSWAVRGTLNPTANWSLQASVADLTSPEGLEPDTDARKWSASAAYARPWGEAGGGVSATFAWGRKDPSDRDATDAWLAEAAFRPDDRWTLFSRAERIETDELDAHGGHGGGGHGGSGHHGDIYDVSKLSLGAVRDFRVAENVKVGLGAAYAWSFVPEALEHAYGERPSGAVAFVRLKID